MLWLSTYIEYLFLYLSLILAFYITGKFVLFMFRSLINVSSWSAYEDLFASLFLGCITIVTIYSIGVTHGKTVHVLFFIVGGFCVSVLHGQRKNQAREFNLLPKCSARQSVELLAYAIAIYTFFALGMIRKADWSTFLLLRQTDDWGVFGIISRTLALTGQENPYDVYNILDPDYWGITPYHYMEMWVAACIRLFLPKLLPLYVIALMVYPFYVLLALTGTWAFIECWVHPSRWLQRLMAFLCFFGTGWFFMNLIRQSGTLELMTSNLTIHYLLLKPRLSLSFACFMSALLLWAKQRETLGLATLLTLPVVSFDSTAVVVGGFVLYGILRFRKQRPTVLHAAIVYGIFLAGAILLYQLFGNKIVSIYNPSVILRQEFALTRNGALFPPLFFLRGLLQITVLYSFHLLMLYWFVRCHRGSRFHDALLLSTLMMGAGIAAWSLLFAMFDSIQVMTSFLACYQTLLLILGVILLTKMKLGARALIGGYIIIGATSNFIVFCLPYLGGMFMPLSREYLNTVQNLSPKSKIGVSIQSKEDFGPWHMRNIAFPLGSNYLPFMPQYLKAVEVGIFDIPATPFRARPNKVPLLNMTIDFAPIDAYRSRTWIEGSAFYGYVQRRRKQQPRLSIEQAQLDFIELHRIDWAILSSNASISPLLQQRILREVRDPLSGERFILLKSEGE